MSNQDTILGFPVVYTDDLPAIKGNEIVLGDLWTTFKNLYIELLAAEIRKYADKELEDWLANPKGVK